MRPRLFEIPIPFLNFSLPINAYGTMMVVGFLLGVYLANRRASRMGLPPTLMTDVGMVAIISGILGARIFYVVQFYNEFTNNWFEALRIDKGGLVFYGGFLTAVVCVSLYARHKKQAMAEILDIATPSLAVGLAFTRIGCFLNGCCWGKVCSTTLPWAVRFPSGSGTFHQQVSEGLLPPTALSSLPVHPTQLYESVAAIGLFFVTSWFFPHRKRPGDVLAIFAVLYSMVRFIIEYLRADNALQFHGLTVSQNLSILIFILGIGWLIWSRLHSVQERGTCRV